MIHDSPIYGKENQGSPGGINSPATELWSTLEKQTKLPTYLRFEEVFHQYRDTRCSSETALKVGDQYYHANFVGKDLCSKIFILAQAPSLKHDINLFWKAIYERKNLVIIDLTNDGDFTVDDHYPETENESNSFKDITVTSKKVNADLYRNETHEYTLTNSKTDEKKEIERYHYVNWYDGGVVSVKDLTLLVEKLETFHDKEILCHCKSGVGRSGTLIAAYILKEMIEKRTVTLINLEKELMKIVLSLRDQRCNKVVSSKELLNLLYEYGLSLLKSKKN